MSNETKESVYDREIAPLIAQIVKVCEREGIAMIAEFELDCRDKSVDVALSCTTILVPENACVRLRTVASILTNGIIPEHEQRSRFGA